MTPAGRRRIYLLKWGLLYLKFEYNQKGTGTMRSFDTPRWQQSGMSTEGADRKPSTRKRWRRWAAPAAVALALSWSTSARAQDTDTCPTDATACLTDALSGVVGGFTGAAGSDLWGWMMGVASRPTTSV